MVRPEQGGSQGYTAPPTRGGCGVAVPVVLALLAGGLITLVLVAGFFLSVGRDLLFPRIVPELPRLALPTPAPTATPRIVTSAAVIRQVQQISRLETTAYSIQTVVTVERAGNALGIGRQRLLVIVQGKVTAGIDLTKLRPEDVTVSADGRRLRLRLPAAEVLSSALDERKTQLYDHQTGLFTQPDTSLVLEAQQAGGRNLLEIACRDGILERATADGQRAVQQFLGLAGFDSVEVETTPAVPCATPTPSTPFAPP